MALKTGEIVSSLDEKRFILAGHPRPPRPILDGSPKQGRLDVPVTEHRRSRSQQTRVDNRNAGPSRFRVDPFKVFMPLIVGNGGDRRFGFLRQVD